jgi:uncharacterized protein YgbK (DUF1537 family)
MGFQADVRAAAMTTLAAHATASSVKLQTYAGRPRSIAPPTAFVDVMRETIVYLGPLSKQRTVQVDIVLIHGSFDSADAAAQKDEFVDGYIDYVIGQVHAAGSNTTLGVVSTEDDPTYVPDWLPREEQRTYYATRITLEGFAGE